MKKQLILALIALGFQTCTFADNKDKLENAINMSDLFLVKKFLKRLGPIDPKEKKQLIETAEDTLDARKEGMTLLSSKWDLAKCIGGTSLALIGAFGEAVAILGVLRGRPELRAPYTAAAAAGGLLFFYGSYKAFNGFYCETAYQRVVNARKVLDEVKKAELIGDAESAGQKETEQLQALSEKQKNSDKMTRQS